MDTESFTLPVLEVVEETADARSITLGVPPGAEEHFLHRPGQFLTVAVPSERTGLVARCYSLSGPPGDLTITVKRTADGYASNWLCDRVRPGDTLRVLPPSGIFTPASLDDDLLLLAGGSGITPVMSIVRTVLARGSGHLVLLYANRDESSVIFAAELAALAATHPERLQVVHWLESVQGLPSQAQLRAFAAAYTSRDAFACGPAPFLRACAAALKELGVPRSRRHQERFVSLDGNPFGDPESVDEVAQASAVAEITAVDDVDEEAVGPDGPARLEVELEDREHACDDWQPGTRMLDHLEAHGVAAPHSCRQGECSACAVRVVQGEVRMLANHVLSEADLAAGYRLGCQSVPLTGTVRVTYR